MPSFFYKNKSQFPLTNLEISIRKNYITFFFKDFPMKLVDKTTFREPGTPYNYLLDAGSNPI